MSSPVSDCVRALWPEPRSGNSDAGGSLTLMEALKLFEVSGLVEWDDVLSDSDEDVGDLNKDLIDSVENVSDWDEDLSDSDEDVEDLHENSRYSSEGAEGSDEDVSDSDQDVSNLREESSDSSDSDYLLWDDDLGKWRLVRTMEPRRVSNPPPRLYLPAELVQPAHGKSDPCFLTPKPVPTPFLFVAASDSVIVSEALEYSESDAEEEDEGMSDTDEDVNDDDRSDDSSGSWVSRRSPRRHSNPPLLYLPIDVIPPARSEFDPRFITPKKGPTPLQLVVLTNQWRFFWVLFVMDTISSWDRDFHPRRLKDSLDDLYALLDLEQVEMRASFDLVQLMYDAEQVLDMKVIQENLMLISFGLHWNKDVVQSLQYKRFYLNNMGLPTAVVERIWKDHVQRDVVHQAILSCAMEIVSAFDGTFASLVANHHSAYESP